VQATVFKISEWPPSVDQLAFGSERSSRPLSISSRPTTFVPERATGLPAPLPSTGEWAFTLAGTLTVHDVAKPTTWQATAKRDATGLTGRATTTVPCSDFNLEKPQAAVTQVVSVSDDTRLQVSFVATQAR
jgi:hypothetical protein